MDVPHRRLHHQRRAQAPIDDDAPVVVYQTIYHTLKPTFKGPVGGYATVEPSVSLPNWPPRPTESLEGSEGVDRRDELALDTEIPSAIKEPDATTIDTSVLAEATGKLTATGTLDVAGSDHFTTDGGLSLPSSTSDTDAASSSSPASSDASTGLSTGAMAGLVFGILGGLFLIGAIIYCTFSRRRKADQAKRSRDDEKLHGPMNGAATALPMSSRSDHKAPRISLRPVTQFFPAWNTDRRSSKGAAMALSPNSANNRAPGGSAWDRPSTSQSMHPNNPFGNQAERAPSPVIEEHNMYDRSLPPTPGVEEQSPFDDPMTAYGPAVTTTTPPAGAATGLSRKTSMRRDGPKNLDLTLTAPLSTVPASPAVSDFGEAQGVLTPNATAMSSGAAAIAAAGGPVNTPVHRVQLDFKPTLEDEMGLNAGDLVRLLHEYDDGWALCIRLDRSQQGVVPRTCLSTRPVKPRTPQGGRPGPPVNPSRPGQPQGLGRPESPAQLRPMSPASRPGSPSGRTTNASGASRPANGPGPSPMNPRQNQHTSPLPPGQAY